MQVKQKKSAGKEKNCKIYVKRQENSGKEDFYENEVKRRRNSGKAKFGKDGVKRQQEAGKVAADGRTSRRSHGRAPTASPFPCTRVRWGTC